MTSILIGVAAFMAALALSIFVRDRPKRSPTPPGRRQLTVRLPDANLLGHNAAEVQQLLADIASLGPDHWEAINLDERPEGRTAVRRLVSAYKESKAQRTIYSLIERKVHADAVEAVDTFLGAALPSWVPPGAAMRARMAVLASLYEEWLTPQARDALLDPLEHFRSAEKQL
jgi:hypothetical protein